MFRLPRSIGRSCAYPPGSRPCRRPGRRGQRRLRRHPRRRFSSSTIPYESFDATVERFIHNAALDPKVLAIQMTVYRVGADTPFLEDLIDRGRVRQASGLPGRVDGPVRRATELAHGPGAGEGRRACRLWRGGPEDALQDDAGGGGKTMTGCAATAHIGTGNYHVKTARLYTDFGLFTAGPVLTGDVVQPVPLLDGLVPPARLRQAPGRAPVNMRRRASWP